MPVSAPSAVGALILALVTMCLAITSSSLLVADRARAVRAPVRAAQQAAPLPLPSGQPALVPRPCFASGR